MSAGQVRIYVCSRVADVATPRPESEQSECDDCGRRDLGHAACADGHPACLHVLRGRARRGDARSGRSVAALPGELARAKPN